MQDTNIIEIGNYIDKIKEYAYRDIVHIHNNVLNKSPYTSNFIQNCLSGEQVKKLSLFNKFRNIFLFYLKNLILFIIYVFCFLIFGTKCKLEFDKELYLIDTFFLTDKIINDGVYIERYFLGLDKVLSKKGKKFAFLPRLVGLEKNPLKLFKLLNILKLDNNHYLFEFELLTFIDLGKILLFILKFPFKQYELLQKENSNFDKNFNREIFRALPNTSFEAYVRYLIGKKISKIFTNNTYIVSWQEFQNLEKTFNRAIKESSSNIFIYGCEFLIGYQNYLSMHITDVDVDLGITPHQTLLNGLHNYSMSSKHSFKSGVALRYKNIFRMKNTNNFDKNFLALLSYDVSESQSLLKILKPVKDLSIKIHPTTHQKKFNLYEMPNWKYTNTDLYDLFPKTSLVFAPTMTGSALEALASGVSVVIVHNQKKILVSPFLDYGRSKIWDIAKNENELMEKVSNLVHFRKKNHKELLIISKWYKDNFFIEPNERNILKAFDL